MIKMVGIVSLFVEDQQRAKDFYVNKLGFELRTEAPLYPGADVKWIEVAPKGAETGLTLYVPDENWAHYKQVVGKAQNITLNVDDLDATYNDLKAKGVKFVSEPSKEDWGTYATIEDSEGNHILLVEG